MAIALVSQGTIAASGSPAFGTPTTAGHLLVAWVGSNGGTASFTQSTTATGWTAAVHGGAAFGWAGIWYKANCGTGETAPVFTDSAGGVQFSQLAEYSGAALSSPVDQSSGVLTAPGLPAWETLMAPDVTGGDLVVAGGFFNGANPGSVISVTQFTDSAGAGMTPHLAQAASGSTYLGTMWGVTSGTGSAGDIAWMQMTLYNGGCGAAASFAPASPVTGTLAVAPQALPAGWLNFPYVTRILAATGGRPAYTWAVSAGSLPTGMTLGTDGTLSSASTTAAGTYNFTAQVTDGNASTATRAFTIVINPAPPGTTLTTASGQNQSLPPGSAYSVPSICPASNGFNSYVSANWVQPTGSYSQTIGAYSPAVFYASANGAPAGTGQVQAGPCYSQQWTDWNGHGWGGGSLNTPLSAFSALSATFDMTSPLTGSFESEFDIWSGYTDTNVPGTGNAQDIMIWMNTTPERAISNGQIPLWHANVAAGGPGGLLYDVYGTPYGGEIIFVLQGPGGTGTYARMDSGTIDLLTPLQWCAANGIDLGNPPFITEILFGWEITNTDTYLGSGTTQAENFVVNSFTYNVQLATPATWRIPGQRAVTRPYRAGRR